MAYTPTKWENSPSTNTPLNADNLNKLESGVKEIHDMAASGQFDGKPGAKGAKGDKGDTGPAGKDGSAIIDATSAGYGLSVNGGKIELGQEESGARVVSLPGGDTPLVIGSVDGNELNGIVKAKGYLLLKEGEANVGIFSPNQAGVVTRAGETPMIDGACRAQIRGIRSSVSAREEVMIAIGDGSLTPSILVSSDGSTRCYNKSYALSDSDYLVVNKKHLDSEISKLIARIEALEAK